MQTIRHFSTLNTTDKQFCQCEGLYISSLRTKLLVDNDFDLHEQEQFTDIREEGDLIEDAEQTDVSQIVNESLEKLNLEPSTPGQILD